MTYDLIMARVIAFLYEAGTLIVLAVLGVLVSPEFQSVVTSHFGDSVTASLIMLAVTGLVKHVRNLSALKKAEEQLGSTDEARRSVILI